MQIKASSWLVRCSPVVWSALFALASEGQAATTYTVKVDAVHDPQVTVAGYSFALVAKGVQRNGGNPLTGEAGELVRLALSQRGFYESPDPKKADFIVEVDFGVRAPRQKITTVRETEMVMPDPTQAIYGHERRLPDGRIYRDPNAPPLDRPEMRTTERLVATSVSEKYVHLTARPNSQDVNQRGALLWRVQAVIEDETPDVHELLGPIINALTDYIGVDTKSQRTVKVKM